MSIQVNSLPPPLPAAGTTQAGGARSDAVSTTLARSQNEQGSAVSQQAEPLKAIKQTQEAERLELENATRKIQKFVEPMTSSLSFSVDEDSGTRVVRVIDNDTKEVIRQVPSEEVLAIAAALDRLQGLFVKEKA